MLKFDERFNETILDGTKKQTIRRHSRVFPGEIHACLNPPFQSNPFTWIEIVSVEIVEWDKITNDDAKREGFAHRDDLHRFLKDAYPGTGFYIDTKLFVIHFELTEAPHD